MFVRRRIIISNRRNGLKSLFLFFICMTNEKIKEVIKNLEKITRDGHSHYEIFDDWLYLMIYALMRDDEKYLKIVKKYGSEGKIGERSIDFFKNAFHELMAGMKKENYELLGDIYTGWNISNKHTGQFFTPKHIAGTMARMTKPKGNVLDPTCGAGVMLVESAKAMSYKDCSEALFVGQDLDQTCVNMCALNLMFFNLNGYVIQGNTLALENNWGYRTSRTTFGGVIREMTEDELESVKPKIAKAIEKKQATLF